MVQRLAVILFALIPSFADVTGCACDISKPETLAARECGLCKEAEGQPVAQTVFVLKDINPRKPNRWLVLPRAHGPRQHSLANMSPEARRALWIAAIQKGKELFGDKWGLAVNGDETRTQCHAHVHVGKLIEGVETARFVVVDGPGDIPALPDGGGLWVHPEGAKLHVHIAEQLTETVLLR
jgi:diadenosine tetraphosphate (Ap4A) HIT family hydrolase